MVPYALKTRIQEKPLLIRGAESVAGLLLPRDVPCVPSDAKQHNDDASLDASLDGECESLVGFAARVDAHVHEFDVDVDAIADANAGWLAANSVVSAGAMQQAGVHRQEVDPTVAVAS